MKNEFAPLGWTVNEFMAKRAEMAGIDTDAEASRRDLSDTDDHSRSIDRMTDDDVQHIRQELKRDVAFRRIMDGMDDGVQLAVLGEMSRAKLWRMLNAMSEDDCRRLLGKDAADDDVRQLLFRKVVAEMYEDDDREVDPEDDPEVDPDDDGEKEEKDDPEDEDPEKARTDEEGDADDDGDDDGGEDDDRAMHDANVLSGYRRPAILNRYSGVLRRR
jgi:hypothetical protein